MDRQASPFEYHAFYNSDDARRWGRAEMAERGEVTRRWLSLCDVRSNAVVVELGCGVGALASLHPSYVGVDLSLVALQRLTNEKRRVNGDMQTLPFRSNAVDFLFSWAALEHVPGPELVLAEIARVLRPGGVVLLAPAWNVRPWAAKALPVRSYTELSWRDRLTKFTIPLRDSLLWRGLVALPERLFREARLRVSGGPVGFDYRRLSPNLTDYVYTDGDAFASMDAHAAIAFFKSRRWSILSQRGFVRQIPISPFYLSG